MKRHEGILWVVVQLILLGALLFAPAGPKLLPPLPGGALQAAGLLIMLISALQLGRALTPLPMPGKAAQLRVSGLFRFVRHPIYSGLLLWALGRVLASGGAWHALIFVALTVFLNAKAAREEKLLHEKFSDYEAYARRTPRFVPRWKPLRKSAEF